jgi:hypothetical protein
MNELTCLKNLQVSVANLHFFAEPLQKGEYAVQGKTSEVFRNL